ncbi:hypothetical protein BTHI11S_03204 [Bosea thiooxidans]
MLDALLVFEQGSECFLRQQEIGGRLDLQPRLAGEIGQEGGQRGDVAAMAVDDQHAVEAVALDASKEGEQHGAVGRDIEGEGAAEGHVVLGHAAPQGRRDDDLDIISALRRRLADAAAENGVDADGQMRPVLLDRGDGEHDDRVRRRLGAQFLGGQILPEHGGHQ